MRSSCLKMAEQRTASPGSLQVSESLESDLITDRDRPTQKEKNGYISRGGNDCLSPTSVIYFNKTSSEKVTADSGRSVQFRSEDLPLPTLQQYAISKIKNRSKHFMEFHFILTDLLNFLFAYRKASILLSETESKSL